MVQQINIPVANPPKVEVKEKCKSESTTPFKAALEKAETYSEVVVSNDSAVNASAEQAEKPAVLVEDEIKADPHQQNTILSALMPWLFTQDMLSSQQVIQNTELLLQSAPIEKVTGLAETQSIATTQGGTVELQTKTPPQMLIQQQVMPLTAASVVENAPAITMPVLNDSVQVQKAALPMDGISIQPVVSETVAPQYAALMPVQSSARVEAKQNQGSSEVSALSLPISSSNVETPVVQNSQNQQNHFDTALSGQQQQSGAESSKETTESQGEFAALFANQNESVHTSTTVHSAPAKLSAGTATHLTDQILKNVYAKNNNFRMELFPHNLGKVSVSMKMEQGMLVVDILADNPKTQSILASGSGEIRSLLESAMGQPVQVTQPQQDAPAYYQQEQESSNQQQESRQNQQESKQETTEDFLTVLEKMKEQSRTL